MDDLISRRMAIDAIDKILPVNPMKTEYTQGITCGAALAMEYVKQLPAADVNEVPIKHKCIICPHCDKYDVNDDGTLSSAQPEQRWIPCKERLPEMDEEVLVTTDWDTVTIGERWYNDKWFIDAGNQNAVDEDIIAWMPLPEPYQGSEQDEKVHY